MGILLLIYGIMNKEEVIENQSVDINKSNKIKNKKIVSNDSNVSLNINKREKTIEKVKVENSEELVMEKEEIEELLEQEKYMQKLFEPKSEEFTPKYMEKMIKEQEALMEEYDI